MASRAILRSLFPSSWNRPKWAYRPIRTVSKAVNGWGESCWGMKAIRRARSLAVIFVRDASPKRSDPESGRSSPASTRSKVVLPAPLGPINPTTSPGRLSKDTFFSTVTPPRFTTTSAATIVPWLALTAIRSLTSVRLEISERHPCEPLWVQQRRCLFDSPYVPVRERREGLGTNHVDPAVHHGGYCD